MHFHEHEGKNVVPLWINGEDTPLNATNLIEVTHSAENKVAHYAHSTTVEDVTNAVEAAQAAFPGWSSTAATARRDILLKASDLLIERADELAAMKRLETCCPPELGQMMGVFGSHVLREMTCQLTTALTGILPYSEETTAITTRLSEAVGRIITQMCGKHLKPILLELGGKGPSIICHDADLEEAARSCAMGAFYHHGQICVATEVAEAFSKLLKEEVEKTWGRGAGTAVQKRFGEKAYQWAKEAVDMGAELLFGDNTYLDEHQTSLKPTIVTNVPEKSRLYDTESFGPSASFFVVENEAEALALANESKYGLSGAVWTRDRVRGIKLAKRVECGMVNINGNTLPNAPPTAVAQAINGSGWGTIQAAAGVQESTVLRAIIVQ